MSTCVHVPSDVYLLSDVYWRHHHNLGSLKVHPVVFVNTDNVPSSLRLAYERQLNYSLFVGIEKRLVVCSVCVCVRVCVCVCEPVERWA